MTDDRENIYELSEKYKKLIEHKNRLANIGHDLAKRLKSARAEAAGRKQYAEDLKAKIIEQHGELCELGERHAKLCRQVEDVYRLVDRHTPFGRLVPLVSAVNWLIEDKSLWRTWADLDSQELRKLKHEHRAARQLLFDVGIFTETLSEGIQQLLNRSKPE